MVARVREGRDNDMDNSGLLFNYLRKRHNLKNETALAKWLDVNPSTLSKIRHGIFSVSAEMILRIYDKSKIPIETIRELINGGTVPKVEVTDLHAERSRRAYPYDARRR